MSKNIRTMLVMLIGLLLITSFFYLLLQVPAVTDWNTDLFLWINQFYWQPLAQVIAVLEEVDTLGFLALVIALVHYNKRNVALAILVAILIETLFTVAVNQAVVQPRPFQVLTEINFAFRPFGYSFPSGHEARMLAAFTVWCVLEKKHYLPFFIFAALIGISRVYIGVHWPMDSIAGAVMGLIIGYSVAKLNLDPLMMRLTTIIRRIAARFRIQRAKT